MVQEGEPFSSPPHPEVSQKTGILDADYNEGLMEEIYISTPPDKIRELNRRFFEEAQQIEDPILREKFIRHYFRVAIKYKYPEVLKRKDWGPFLASGLLNFEIRKALLNGQWYYLIFDGSKFEDLFVFFFEEFRNRRKNPGEPLLKEGQLPNELAALIKSLMTACLNFFGRVQEATSSDNIKMYEGKKNPVPLSSFGSRKGAATCTEFTLLSHQFAELAGFESIMINGGVLNIFDKDGNLLNDGEHHNFQMIVWQEEGKEPTYILFDPVNYKVIRNSNEGYVFFPFVTQISKEDFLSFLTGKPISIGDGDNFRDYYG